MHRIALWNTAGPPGLNGVCEQGPSRSLDHPPPGSCLSVHATTPIGDTVWVSFVLAFTEAMKHNYL